MNNEERRKYSKKYCKVCGYPLVFIDWWEANGETQNGDYQPYYECINNCKYPELDDSELTAEELKERKNENKQ